MKGRPVFFDDLLGLIGAAKIVATARNVSLAEASDFLERLLVDDGTAIYAMVAGHQIVDLGEACYAPACDYVVGALNDDWWNRPELLEERLQPDGYLRDELAISRFDAIRLLDVTSYGSQLETASSKESDIEISGQTFARLQRAIAAFPGRYPDYKTKPPKLNDDVRPWLSEVGLVNDGAKGREASVFGRIIAEHFKLSDDTQKT